MNTVVNGGAIVEECLLNSNGGRDISLSAINGSINSNEESTSPPLLPPPPTYDAATTEESNALSSLTENRLSIPNFIPYQNQAPTARSGLTNGSASRIKLNQMNSMGSYEMKTIIPS